MDPTLHPQSTLNRSSADRQSRYSRQEADAQAKHSWRPTQTAPRSHAYAAEAQFTQDSISVLNCAAGGSARLQGLGPMVDFKDRSLASHLKRNARSNRGGMYQWLWDNQAAVAKGLAHHQAGWDAVIERMTAAGVAGRHGAKPNRSSTVRVWALVCRDKAAAEAGAVERKPIPRKVNRSPRDNTAPMAATASPRGQVAVPARPNSPFAPNATTLATPARGRPSPEEAQEIARRQLDPRGRYLPPRSTT